MKKKEVYIKNATILAVYILLVWGLYRFLVKLPEDVEELFIKPVVWLLPVFYFLKKEKLGVSSLGISFKNLFPSVYMALGLGVFFVFEALLINYIKYGALNFNANIGSSMIATSLGISFMTAFSEELTFRGYFFNRLLLSTKNEWLSIIVSSVVWALVHVPITVFVWKLSVTASITYLFLTAIFGVGSAFIFSKTKNIASSILLHVLWEWPLILFR